MLGHVELIRRLGPLLASVPGVTGAAYFGSIARGTADALSDVDLIVRADASAAETSVGRIDREIGVVLHRPFTEVDSPSGRYWFHGMHPFARLDVSFHPPDEYDAVFRRGDRYVQPPLRPIQLDAPRPAEPEAVPETPRAWSAESHAFAGALRDYQEIVKALARGRSPKRPLTEGEAEVEACSRETIPPLAWALYEQSRELASTLGVDRTSKP